MPLDYKLGTKEEGKHPSDTFVLGPPETIRRGCDPAELPFADTEAWASRHWPDAHQGNKLSGAILLPPRNQDAPETIPASAPQEQSYC